MIPQERPGHVVGGGGGGNNQEEPLSNEEIRRRRLAALAGGAAAVASPTIHNPTPTVDPPGRSITNSAFSSLMTAASVAQNDDEEQDLQAALAMSLQRSQNSNEEMEVEVPPDDQDEDLQAALAMSMQKEKEEKSQNENRKNAPIYPPTATAPAAQDPPPVSQDVLMKPAPSNSSSSAFDISAFHAIMWSTQFTTDNDKSRWLNQGIDVRDNSTAAMEISPREEAKAPGGPPPYEMNTRKTLLTTVGSSFEAWGLVQAHGGPCGVLAAIQAEMLRLLIFGRTEDAERPLEYPMFLPSVETENASAAPSLLDTTVTEDLVRQALAMSIAMILARAALTPPANEESDNASSQAKEDDCVKLVIRHVDSLAAYEGLTWDDLEPWKTPSSTAVRSSSLQVHTISAAPSASDQNNNKRQKTEQQQQLSRDDRIVDLANAVSNFLLDSSLLDHFRKPGGVILLVMSLVASRGDSIITNEMDDPQGTKLTSQFGHCSQELINLLLTGQAVSNVFDNTLTPSGELTCRGIQSRPAVGYLSQLEAMRYCEVGGYYKNPRFPIWVVGSTSHFTVLFGEAAALKESQSDALLEKCRRAFKAVEGGEENGFIAKDSLGKVLETLEIDVGGESVVQTLAAMLEVSGAGIILWDDFWKAASRLLTGASVETVLNGTSDTAVSKAVGNNPQGDDTLLLTQFGESGDQKPAALDQKPPAKPSGAETDEEMARRLADEWETGASVQRAFLPETSPISSPVAAARPPSPMEVDHTMSDEEYARKLQEQWNAEASGGGGAGSSVAAVSGTPPPSSNEDHRKFNVINLNDDDSDYDDLPDLVAANPADDYPTHHQRTSPTDFRFGDSIQLYHYNGLRGGTLTPFRVTRLSSEEAVGASIALTQHSAGGASTHSSAGGNGDLEDVIRTKYPSSSINWLGRTPPNID